MCRVEFFKIGKRDVTFIREMRVFILMQGLVWLSVFCSDMYTECNNRSTLPKFFLIERIWIFPPFKMHSLCNTWSYIILYETWFWHNNSYWTLISNYYQLNFLLSICINMKTYFTLFVYIFTVSQACVTSAPISKRKFMTLSHQIPNSQFRISNLSEWSKVCLDARK